MKDHYIYFGSISIICEHVHRLKLRKSLKFWVAGATYPVYKKPCLSVILVVLVLDMHV